MQGPGCSAGKFVRKHAGGLLQDAVDAARQRVMRLKDMAQRNRGNKVISAQVAPPSTRGFAVFAPLVPGVSATYCTAD